MSNMHSLKARHPKVRSFKIRGDFPSTGQRSRSLGGGGSLENPIPVVLPGSQLHAVPWRRAGR